MEIVVAMPISELPATVASYIAKHYKGMKMLAAGKVIDAASET